jgi:hypothetical protein
MVKQHIYSAVDGVLRTTHKFIHQMVSLDIHSAFKWFSSTSGKPSDGLTAHLFSSQLLVQHIRSAIIWFIDTFSSQMVYKQPDGLSVHPFSWLMPHEHIHFGVGL